MIGPQGGGCFEKPSQMGRNSEFGTLQADKKNTRLLLNRFCDDMALRHLHGQH